MYKGIYIYNSNINYFLGQPKTARWSWG